MEIRASYSALLMYGVARMWSEKGMMRMLSRGGRSGPTASALSLSAGEEDERASPSAEILLWRDQIWLLGHDVPSSVELPGYGSARVPLLAVAPAVKILKYLTAPPGPRSPRSLIGSITVR